MHIINASRDGATRKVTPYAKFAVRLVKHNIIIYSNKTLKLSHETLFEWQQYKSGYTAPRQLFHYTGISMNFRYFLVAFTLIIVQNTENHVLWWDCHRSDWGIEALDLRNPYFLSDDHELYSFHSPTSLICCRVIALLVCFFSLTRFLRTKPWMNITIFVCSSSFCCSCAILFQSS